MIAIAFLAGIIVGAAATCWVATWFADRPKSEAKSQHGVAATSVPMNDSGVVTLDSYNARLLQAALEKYEGRA
jgi:hypothetical protein